MKLTYVDYHDTTALEGMSVIKVTGDRELQQE